MGKQTRSNMPLDESKLSFKIPRTDQPREKIVKLGKMITDREFRRVLFRSLPTGSPPNWAASPETTRSTGAWPGWSPTRWRTWP